MKRRYALFAMTTLLAVAVAVPAFGGPDNPVSEVMKSAKSTAKKALKKAKEANKAAKQAQKSADNAQSSADGAQATADAAGTAAADAQSAADAAQASADAAQATANSKYGTMDVVFGETSDSNPNDSKLVFATCPTGTDVTGGGFAIGGTGPGDVAPTVSSQYLNAWTVTANEVNAIGTNWTVQANVECIAP